MRATLSLHGLVLRHWYNFTTVIIIISYLLAVEKVLALQRQRNISGP